MNRQAAILITIDVEDWFMVENMRPWIPPATWDQRESRVELNTHYLLNLLDSIDLSSNGNMPVYPRATFFILGWIADRIPNIVNEIHKRGHEVASHGYGHLMCNQMSETDLKQDLIRSKKTLEDITGVEVNGYRAPNFSINDHALRLIRASGYRYDSSYNNFSRHGRYGVIAIDGKPTSGMAVRMDNDFHEIPISNLTIGNKVIPWGGGGYFRFWPETVFNAGVKRILQKKQAYNFYIHPWEIDSGQPRVREAKGLSAFRHYLNLEKTHARLHKMITLFRSCKFPTCTQYLNEMAFQARGPQTEIQ